MTLNEMTTTYNAHSAAHTYALGFHKKNNLYVKLMNFAELSRYFKLCRASSKRGGYAKVRICLSAADRDFLTAGAELLGSVDQGQCAQQGRELRARTDRALDG